MIALIFKVMVAGIGHDTSADKTKQQLQHRAFIRAELGTFGNLSASPNHLNLDDVRIFGEMKWILFRQKRRKMS